MRLRARSQLPNPQKVVEDERGAVNVTGVIVRCTGLSWGVSVNQSMVTFVINQWNTLSGPCNRPHTTASKRKSCVLVNVWMQGWEFRKRSFAISFRLLASLRRDVSGAPYEGALLPSKPITFSGKETTDNDSICMHGWVVCSMPCQLSIHAYK